MTERECSTETVRFVRKRQPNNTGITTEIELRRLIRLELATPMHLSHKAMENAENTVLHSSELYIGDTNWLGFYAKKPKEPKRACWIFVDRPIDEYVILQMLALGFTFSDTYEWVQVYDLYLDDND